jgi:hypothetical protein
VCYCTLRAKPQTESFTPRQSLQFPANCESEIHSSLINLPIVCKFDSPNCKNYPVRFTTAAGKSGSFTRDQQTKGGYASRIE